MSPGYDTKQYNGEASVTLKLWELTPLFPSLWPGVLAPDKIPAMGQIELNCVLMLNWNRTVYSYKNVFGIK